MMSLPLLAVAVTVGLSTAIGAVVSAVSPSPSPSPRVYDETTVTPGVAGFFAIIFVAIAVVLLAIDMTRRIRRTRYRGEIAEKLDAEELENRVGELDARAAALSDEDLISPDESSPSSGEPPRP